MIEIKIAEDHSEIVPYNFKDFKVHAKKYWLSHYPNMCAASHWHDDVEFIFILKGRMLYSINGTEYLLEQGQCMFVNSRQLHYGYAKEQMDCEFLCMLLHPSLLSQDETIKATFVDAICQNSSLPYQILKPTTSWHMEIILHIKTIYEDCQKEKPGFELAVLSNFYSLWHILYQNISNIEVVKERKVDKKMESLHGMIGFIQRNFTHKISLNEIALAGCVCRSQCCDIFKAILGVSPIQYLLTYRIEKSLEFLRNSSLSVTDIALQCGFNSSSYYTELFHKSLHCTPSEYKKRIMI